MKTIIEIAILLAAGSVISLLVNRVSPSGIPLIGQWDTSKGVIRADKNDPYGTAFIEINDVSVAREIYEKGNVVFVDARSDDHYTDGHVKGAVSLPVGDFENRFEKFYNQYPMDKPIIVYCSGRTCEDSHRLAQMLADFGYVDVSVMIDGFPGWEAGGYPIE